MKTYRLLGVKYSPEYTKILECLDLQAIDSLKEGKTDDVIIEYYQNDTGDDFFEVYGILRDGPVYCLKHAQHGKINTCDIRFLTMLQGLFLKYHARTDENFKQVVILHDFGVKPADTVGVEKGRFILERDFDPDAPVPSFAYNAYVMGFSSDRIDINIQRTQDGYALKIFRHDWQFQKDHLQDATEVTEIENKMEQASRLCQTVAHYSCFLKARDALLNIVKTTEKCRIYGRLDKCYTHSNLARFNNNTIIKAYQLQNIL